MGIEGEGEMRVKGENWEFVNGRGKSKKLKLKDHKWHIFKKLKYDQKDHKWHIFKTEEPKRDKKN